MSLFSEIVLIGAAGSGKPTLALAAIGVLLLADGTVQLGGTALTAYEPDNLRQYIRYLPQKMQLLPGTVAENITRYQPGAQQDLLFAAARNAGAFEMITQLPQGFDTDVRHLSGRQAQRIGLARALFGDPVLLVLDEPNSNLDNEGVAALQTQRHYGADHSPSPCGYSRMRHPSGDRKWPDHGLWHQRRHLTKNGKNHVDISALSARGHASYGV